MTDQQKEIYFREKALDNITPQKAMRLGYYL
jgi:hypothetical protein